MSSLRVQYEAFREAARAASQEYVSAKARLLRDQMVAEAPWTDGPGMQARNAIFCEPIVASGAGYLRFGLTAGYRTVADKYGRDYTHILELRRLSGSRPNRHIGPAPATMSSALKGGAAGSDAIVLPTMAREREVLNASLAAIWSGAPSGRVPRVRQMSVVVAGGRFAKLSERVG